jgi:hypothetical protein
MAEKAHQNGKKKYDVFISYSSQDRAFALAIAQDMVNKGVKIWIDQANLTAGTPIAEAILDGLRATTLILIVMSPDYFASNWTRQEWQYGLSRGLETGTIRIIPILFRDCDIPLALKVIQYADFRDPSRYYENFSLLLHAVKNALAMEANLTSDSEIPKIGEQIEEPDPQIVSDLKYEYGNAARVFQAKPAESPQPSSKKKSTTEDDLCFVIMPFSVPDLNDLYEYFIEPVLREKCKLRPERGDDTLGSNAIIEDIKESIQKARIIVADLTGRNPNVFYEVGIAHTLNKPVLLMTQSIDDVPFDLRHRRTLVYQYTPPGCKKLEKSLYENIQKMLKDG